MIAQNQFTLTFTQLIIKSPLTSESILRISLLSSDPATPNHSDICQTQELALNKTQKIINLKTINPFSFTTTLPENKVYSIKYQIKGTSNDRVRLIPINTAAMIQEHSENKTNHFDQNFSGSHAQIFYQFALKTISKSQAPSQLPEAMQTNLNSQQEEDLRGSYLKMSSIKAKRPPKLSIVSQKNNCTIQSVSAPKETVSKVDMKVDKQSEIRGKLFDLLAVQSTHKQQPKEQHEEPRTPLSAMPVIQRKFKPLGLTQHYRKQNLISLENKHDSHHKSQLSIKLKIVIFMLIFGVCFLVFHSFRQPKPKSKKAKQAKGHRRDTHESSGH